MKKTRIIATILLTVILGFAIYIFTVDTTKINISKDTIDFSISKKLPIHKDLKIPLVKGVSVDINEIQTNFDNNITFQISGNINYKENSVKFNSHGKGELYYKDQAFFFKPIGKISVNYDTNPAKFIEAKLTDNKGLSRFIPKKIKKSILDAKDVHSSINQKIQETIEAGIIKYLKNNKVYSFKEGTFLKIGVKNVFVEPQQIIVEVSLIEMTKQILFKVIGFLFMIVGLIMIIIFPVSFLALFSLSCIS
jgi:hypothetical protein